MKNQTYRMTLLFDFYGDVLTDRQKEFYDLYYNEDLSLAEIAENYNLTRQGVRDVIVRAEAVMTELEDKTGIIKRFKAMQAHVQAICDQADSLLSANHLSTFPDPSLEEGLRRIKAEAEAIKE